MLTAIGPGMIFLFHYETHEMLGCVALLTGE